MELRHLRYFIAAAEEEHFGRASERLHVTRPAVSQIIADLEDELGTPLFERLAHRVKLTAAGRSLLPQLQKMMNELNEAFAITRRVGQGKSGTLSLGYGSLTLLHTLFRAAIKQYHESYPDVSVSLLELTTSEQPRALAEGRIHAGFMHFGPGRALLRKKRAAGAEGPDDIVLDWIRVQTGGLGIAVPSDHRFAQRKSLTIADLAGEGLVVLPNSSVSPGYGPLYALCQKAGFEPLIVQDIGLVVMGRNFNYPAEVSVVPLTDVNYPTNFIFGWVKGKLDPALERMIEIVKVLAK
jgi:DNA-binding transcriptional LysR family regulator